MEKPIVALIFVFLGAMLTGCATPKEWIAIGGSRSDGTIKLAFDYGLFEKPELQPSQANRLATQKCRVWGY